VREHEAICVETLNVKGLARTKLAKSVHDAGWGMFRRMLEYKSQWQGKHFQKIERSYPSTQLCHDCGERHHSLTLADREWACPACGVVHDRDLNAALNIRDQGLSLLRTQLAEGCSESPNARGEHVRPPQGAMLVEAGSPRL
jgi:putative transposase